MSDRTRDLAIGTTQKALPAIIDNKTAVIAQFGETERFTVVEDPGTYHKLALSADGNTIAAAASNVVCIWNTKTRERLDRQVFACVVRQIAITGDGQGLLVVDATNSIHAIDIPFSARTALGKHKCLITALGIDPSGSKAAMGDIQGNVFFFEPFNFVKNDHLQCTRAPGKLTVNLEQDVLTVLTQDSVQVFRISSKEKLGQFGVDGEVERLGHIPEVPLVNLAENVVSVFDAVSGTLRTELQCLASEFDVTADASCVITASPGRVHVWDAISGNCLKEVKTYVYRVADVKICNDARSIYLCGDRDASIEHYQVESGRLASFVDLYCGIMAAATTDDDRRLVVADQRGVITVYDLATGAAKRYQAHGACISKMAVRGSWVATGAHDGLAKVLDIDTGAELYSVDFAGQPVQAIALGARGMLATGNCLGAMQLHDVARKTLVREYYGNTCSIRSLSISGCERFIMSTAEDGNVLVFDYESAELINQYNAHGMVYTGCFGDTGHDLFYGTDRGVVVRARVTVSEVIDRWPLHGTDVRSITICGSRLCSIGIGDDARIVDLANGKVILECPVSTRPYRRIAFLNKDATRFVTGGADGCLMFRDPKDGSVLAALHNLGSGFLFTTLCNGRKYDQAEWFWTDREELIQVHNQVAGIETLLPPTDTRHKEFVQSHKNRPATMAAVGMSPDVAKHAVGELLDARGQAPAGPNHRTLPRHLE
jgi:WD40 repeat protein